jgi:hypothetical protein
VSVSHPTVHVVGRGVVGSRLYRMLSGSNGIRSVLHGGRWAPGGTEPGDVVVLAHPGASAERAADLVGRGRHVVTTGETVPETERLLAVGSDGASLVVGATMAPGLSGLIARHLAVHLQAVDEIHVAIHGTAGPACARAHHRSLSGIASSWRDGRWVDHVGGSGRQLCWFPEPVGAKDCYRARVSSPLVLRTAFPEVSRLSFRRSARRRDRFTAWLPMLSPPHQEGGVGALRVELRGGDAAGGRHVLVAGVAELVGTSAAATAAAFATALADGLVPPGTVVPGDERLPTVEILRRIEHHGVRLQEFTGIPTV